jgi:hypothetical protein
MNDKPTARRGRPPVAETQRLTERAEIRLTQAQREKFEALGGAEWVRGLIDKAKVTARPPTP